jgi:hypothetical protein
MLSLPQHLPPLGAQATYSDCSHPACGVPRHAEFISAPTPGAQPSRLLLRRSRHAELASASTPTGSAAIPPAPSACRHTELVSASTPTGSAGVSPVPRRSLHAELVSASTPPESQVPYSERSHPACGVPRHAEFISASTPPGLQPSRLPLRRAVILSSSQHLPPPESQVPYSDSSHLACGVPRHAEFISAPTPGAQPSRLLLRRAVMLSSSQHLLVHKLVKITMILA